MTVIERDGRWYATNGEAFFGPFDTMAQAWRWVDRVEGDPVSAAEKRAEFGWNVSTQTI